MLDIISFFEDYGIPYWTSGKNVTEGWVNTTCPFCHDRSNHLGFSPEGNFHCWKCGSHNFFETLSILSNLDIERLKKILKKYYIKDSKLKKDKDKFLSKKVVDYIQLPISDGISPVNQPAFEYLSFRNYDPYFLSQYYSIYSTNHLDVDYKFRIIIPIFYNKKIVSFTSRDYTNCQELRYKSASQDNEIVSHKNILYNLDNCQSDFCIVTEGIFDCWRLGDNCCSTFGVSFTQKQINLLSNFKRVFIIFDNDESGKSKAKELSENLKIFSVETIIVDLPSKVKDVSDLTPEEALNLKKYITKKFF